MGSPSRKGSSVNSSKDRELDKMKERQRKEIEAIIEKEKRREEMEKR